MYASYILGARRGRFKDSNGNKLPEPGLTKGHSTALQMLGTMILWFGWYGFNVSYTLVLTATSEVSNIWVSFSLVRLLFSVWKGPV